MISVICVYNDELVFHNCLSRSLSSQKYEFEFVPVDNTENRFESAAEALNWGGRLAIGDFLMFVHQDVDLRSDSWLKSTEALLKSLPNLGIAGVAGANENEAPFKERCTNTITHRPPSNFRSGVTHGPRREPWGIPIREPELVQTLDECLVIIPKSAFNVLQFDEVTCSNWHLYAVDYCLSIATRGFAVYAIPSDVYHQSKGAEEKNLLQVIASLSLHPKAYYGTLEHVLRKHKNYYKLIYTSCGSWNTKYPLLIQRFRHVLGYIAASFINSELSLQRS